MDNEPIKRYLARTFIFSLCWAFIGSIDVQHHSKFETFLMSQFNISDLPKGSIFDYQLIHGGEWASWNSTMGNFLYSKDKSYFELVVPTKDTVRYSWLVRNAIKNQYPIFLTGMTGVGKSIIV
jgi:dynein heavy chain